MSRTVVVTGLGATTPLGGTITSTWEALLAGRSGISTLEQEWVGTYDLPVRIGGQLAVPAADVLTRVETKRMDPSAQYATIATREAWQHAGAPEVEPERLAVAIGTGIGGFTTTLHAWDTLREKGARRVYPLSVPMLMPSSPAGNIALELGARGGARTPISACASGAEAMALGRDLIRDGKVDVVVAGGTEAAIHPLTYAGFSAMQALSTRNDSPETASRPYDTGRDGFVMAEGAAVLVLESEEHAKARGAHILAELAGTGISSDAHHIVAPEPEGAGASLAMRWALEDAGLSASDVCHVNAHATSTPVGDIAEANAIRWALGDAADGVAVSGTKSQTGHLLGAAGALEALFTIPALRDRLAPAVRNIEDFDEQVTIDVVRDEHRALPAGQIAAMDNSFGFGGANVALLFRTR